MAVFDYKGFSATGDKVSGSCEGNGQRAVTATLRERGIFVTELVAAGKKSPSGPSRWFHPGRPRLEDLAVTTRQLATLLSAGVTLDVALDTVAVQLDQARLSATLKRVREGVVQGESLHQSLAAEGLFSPLYLSLVEVGEQSGTLDQSLAGLADLLEEQARLHSRITAALAYPLLMAIVGCGVLLFLITFVLPKVTRMLIELEQTLPWPTRLLMGGTSFLQQYGWLLALLLALLLVLLRRWAASPAGRFRLDRYRLWLPLLGRLQLLLATSRFSRTLATLIGNGLSLLRALDISAGLLNNRLLQQNINDIAGQVHEGESLARALRKKMLFPAILPQMVAIGEKSGELEQMLLRVAQVCDQQVELTINRLLALLEPIMILLMGSVVGFIVLAVLLPIFQASQSLG